MNRKPKKKKRVGSGDPLSSWAALNVALMKLDDPDDVARLLKRERGGADRLVYTLRIHARLNKLRRERERLDLLR